jgi:ABC-type multidrug transport system fused ATPase/permease subunit
LARAVLADPDILLLVEPTSAVDAHTEARIIDRLAQARAGRTTVVTSASPLVLDAADEVILLEGGTATVRGTHAELVGAHAAYREVVTRGEDT